jgi:YVTN family beta-propeller protein
MKKLFLTLGIVSSFLFTACEKEKDDETPAPPPVTSDQLHGVFVVNEGPFGSGTGRISYLSSDGSYFNEDLYHAANSPATLGDLVQSMSIYNLRGYIVVNNSFKIEVVDMRDFKSAGTITGFSSPRYFLPVNPSKAYVSDWSSNTIKIVNLNTLTVTGTIPAGDGPEQMIMTNNKVYVCNTGGFGLDSTVTVIDPASDVVINTLTVGFNPGSFCKTNTGDVLVLCSGTMGPDYIGGNSDDLPSYLVKINTSTDAVDTVMSFGQFFHPVKMIPNADLTKLYTLYSNSIYGGTVKLIDTVSQTISPVVDEYFYGLGIDPSNGNIYGGRYDFTANCYMVRYTSGGALIDSMQVGIGPNSFVFN